jgi:hypothetical protein
MLRSMHSLRILTYSALTVFPLAACSSKPLDTDTDSPTSDPSTADATESTSSTTTTTGPTSTASESSSTTTDATSTDSTTTTTTTTTASGGLEPGGANPCGSCAEGEYCHWQPADQPECAETLCKPAGENCEPCFAAPDECAPATLSSCLATRCYMEDLFEKAELADDGIVVVHCALWVDTGCGS